MKYFVCNGCIRKECVQTGKINVLKECHENPNFIAPEVNVKEITKQEFLEMVSGEKK